MELQYFFARKLDADDWKIFQQATKILDIYPNLDEGCRGKIKQNTDIAGLKFDFNFGLRIDIPRGDYHVKISDIDSGTVFVDSDISDTRLISFEKNYIHWRIEVKLRGELVLLHDFDLVDKPVLIHFLFGLFGDTLAYLPYIRDFQKIHRANVKLLLPEYLREFANHVYPELEQVDANNYETYATFYPAMHLTDLNFLTWNTNHFPIDHSNENYFGLNHIAAKSKFIPTSPREIAEPYVCISIQASMINKTWQYQGGWDIVVDYLKKLGYRVLCIDKAAEVSSNGYTSKIPAQVENFTGNLPIMNRANMLYHADFFIGLGSGLSWLANAVDCPVVLIAGFSQDWCEFHTPYRVSNKLVCNGCYNDNRVNFLSNFCFYHHDTARELECSKKISPRMVIDAIENLIINENLTVPKAGELNGI